MMRSVLAIGLFALALALPNPREKVIKCESINYKPMACSVGFYIHNMRMLIQHSKSKCIDGQTFFAAHSRVQVVKGCRATFKVEGSQTQLPRSFTIIKSISSINFKKASHTFFKGVGNSFPKIASVDRVEQYSKSPCEYGTSFYEDNSGNRRTVYAVDGCRALFAANFGNVCTVTEEEAVLVTDVTYNPTTTVLDPDAQATATTVHMWTSNQSPDAQQFGTVSTVVSRTQTTSFTFDASSTTSIEISNTVSVSAGLPKIGLGAEGSTTVTVGTEISFGASETTETSSTQEISIETPDITVPAYSNLAARFEASMLTATVPFTAKVLITNGCTTRTEQVTGRATISGIVSTGNIRQQVGPATPVECISPDDPLAPTAFADFFTFKWCEPINGKCNTNPLCKRTGNFGDNDTCCPTESGPNGVLFGCCAATKARETCQGQFPDNIPVCPSLTGKYDPCCGLNSPGGASRTGTRKTPNKPQKPLKPRAIWLE